MPASKLSDLIQISEKKGSWFDKMISVIRGSLDILFNII